MLHVSSFAKISIFEMGIWLVRDRRLDLPFRGPGMQKGTFHDGAGIVSPEVKQDSDDKQEDCRRYGYIDIDKKRRGYFILSSSSSFTGGRRGIRTPGTLIEYVSLANWWFQPLTHPSFSKATRRPAFEKALQR